VIIRTTASILLALSSCAAVSSIQKEPVVPGPKTIAHSRKEDSAVLSFVFKSHFRLPFKLGKGFVVQRESVLFRELQDALSFKMHRRRHKDKDVREAFDDFAKRNAKPSSAPTVDIGVPITVATRMDIEKIFKHGFWPAFYKKYPNTDGLLSLCLPGFSSDGNTALVFAKRSSDGRNAEASLLLLHRKNGNWSVKEFISGWVA
jgi:hypothetical protein